jgi:hypothetical protein
MEARGVLRVARYSLRRMLTKALTVEMAARVYRVPPDEFLAKLRTAVAAVEAGEGPISARADASLPGDEYARSVSPKHAGRMRGIAPR